MAETSGPRERAEVETGGDGRAASEVSWSFNTGEAVALSNSLHNLTMSHYNSMKVHIANSPFSCCRQHSHLEHQCKKTTMSSVERGLKASDLNNHQATGRW